MNCCVSSKIIDVMFTKRLTQPSYGERYAKPGAGPDEAPEDVASAQSKEDCKDGSSRGGWNIVPEVIIASVRFQLYHDCSKSTSR